MTIVMAIMCHLPDPLNFLAAVARITKGALLFWGQIINTDALLVTLQPPHTSLSSLTDFSHAFNDNTRISKGLLAEAARQLGFKEMVEIRPRATWLTELTAPQDNPIERQLKGGSPHSAILLV